MQNCKRDALNLDALTNFLFCATNVYDLLYSRKYDLIMLFEDSLV